jgi:glycosyltransferase involved in cell wall biosynthesis
LKRLVVIHYPFFGGPHNQALRLTEPLARRGIETLVVIPHEPGNAAARLRSSGVDVLQVPLARLRASKNPVAQGRYIRSIAGDVKRLRHIIRQHRIDLVEIAGLVNMQAGVAARFERTPVVWQLLDTRTPQALRRALMPVVLRLSDAVMTTGQGVADAHQGAASLNGRLVTFFPPVDVEGFRPDPSRRAAARKKFGICTDSTVVGTVANLTPQKRLECLIQASVQIRASCPTAEVVIFGRPMETHLDYEAQLRRAAHELNVKILTPSDGVDDVLRTLDVFVMTAGTRSEGITTTVLEAMSVGVPVVTTDVGALREAVEHGGTGLVVSPTDEKAIAHGVVRLVRDPGLRRAMSERSRSRAEQLFDAEECADAHVHAYEVALHHAAATRGQREG